MAIACSFLRPASTKCRTVRKLTRVVEQRSLYTAVQPLSQWTEKTEFEDECYMPFLRRELRGGECRKGSKTEFEHRFDDAVHRHLPKPGPGGFARGCIIGWRRADRYPSACRWSVADLYETTGVIAEGGFGIVHSARHRRTGEIVAIKSLPKDSVQDAEALQLEIEFLKVADHPNVVRYYESFEDDKNLYLVMEMCSGGALSQHVQAAHDCYGIGISESDMARVMMQMLRGVAYCHAHSIVHRDLKPQNFLFGCGAPQKHSVIPRACSGDTDAPLKLVDFGISGVVRSDKPQKRMLTKRAGTDGYMAPEVVRCQPYGPSADMFSLGAVMHMMLVGKTPRWDGAKQMYDFPGRMRWRQLSVEGQTLLARLLHADPAERPTAIEAIQDPWFPAMGVSVPGNVTELLHDCVRRVCQFSHQSKLQQSIMYSMVAFAPLHNHYMEQLRIAFLAADQSGSGGITLEEFAKLVRSSQVSLEGCISLAGCSSEGECIEAIFTAVNVSQSGKISYSEWLAATAPQAWYDTHEYAQRAFDTLDVNRHGYITANDLCEVLPGVFRVEELAQEIKCINSAGDGRLTFKEFCALSTLDLTRS